VPTATEEIVRRVVRSYAEAVHIFKTNKPATLRMFQKYLEGEGAGYP
jgi:hypothetical protein